MTREGKKQRAKRLYMTSDFSTPEIAKMVGVDPSTAYNWIRKEEWEKLKAEELYGADNRYREYRDMLNALKNDIKSRDKPIPSSKEADVISKLEKNLREMKKSLRLEDYIKTFKELGVFLKTKDEKFYKDYVSHSQEFLTIKASEYGGR